MGDVTVFPGVRAHRSGPRPFEDARKAEWHGAPASATPAAADCACTAGHVCRHNNACPRRPAPALSLVGPRP